MNNLFDTAAEITRAHGRRVLGINDPNCPEPGLEMPEEDWWERVSREAEEEEKRESDRYCEEV